MRDALLRDKRGMAGSSIFFQPADRKEPNLATATQDRSRVVALLLWSEPAEPAPYTDLVNGHYAARPLPCSLQGPNVGRIPEGCQMVAGGRSEAAERATTGKRVMERLHPRGMPDRPLRHMRRDRKQCPCSIKA